MQTSLVVVLAGLAQQSGPHPLAPPSLTHNGAAWPANSQPKPLHDSKAAGGTLPLNTAPVIADVAVYGASSAGVIAAVAAARAQPSLRVVLLAPTSHIGGITSAGLGCVDAGNGSVVGGFAREFYTRVGQAYGLPHNTAAWRITPAVAQQVFAAMLAEANVTLLTSVGDVQFCGPTDASATPAPAPGTPPRQSAPWVLTTAAGPSTTAAVLIDGTYEADLAYACGATVTWGREARAQYNESNAGVLSEPSPLSAGHCQFNVDLDPYDDAGRLLPLVPSPRPSGPAGEGDDKVMAYTFRVCITNRSDILVPFARPPQYDPNHWTLLARFIEASNFTSVNSLIWRFALPEGKFDVCNYGPLSTMPVGLQWGWPNGTTEERSVIFEAHRSHVAGMLYFLANDPRVPQTIRMDISSFGLCGDEFNATAHWPPELCVAETCVPRHNLPSTPHSREPARVASFHPHLAAHGWRHWAHLMLSPYARL